MQEIELVKRDPKPVQVIRLRNKKTGKIFTLKRNAALRFKTACLGLKNYLEYHWKRKFCVHVTLTCRENYKVVDYVHFNRVVTMVRTKLRRRGVEVKYVAVREFQKRGAIHFHVLFFYNKAYQFCNVKEIEASWDLGYAKIVPVDGMENAYRYLVKYLSKTVEDLAYGFKVFSTSHISAVYRLPSERFRWCLSRVPIDLFDILVVSGRNLYIACVDKPNVLIHKFDTDWEMLGTLITDDPKVPNN